MKISGPKSLLHLEGLAFLVAACLLYGRTGESWGKFALLFLAPDLLMVGYVFGRKFGAQVYNAGHTYTTPILLWVIARLAHHPLVLPFCLIWVAHIGFDRLLGFGLKYDTAFKDTHLGKV
jgi:hypothetical protein